jgi:Bacterial toxin 37
MLYKTIVLELLQDQYPKLHARLARERMLLSTLNEQAMALKRYHETRMEQLTLAKPDSDPALLASQAMELALQDLRDDLWRGQPNSDPGGPSGNWYNPNTGESLRPDLDHPEPIGPHWDYRAPDGTWYRWFPNGGLSPKSSTFTISG